MRYFAGRAASVSALRVANSESSIPNVSECVRRMASRLSFEYRIQKRARVSPSNKPAQCMRLYGTTRVTLN